MRSALLALALLLSPLTPQAVANRCAGEAEFAIPECSCAVKNRLLIGWAPSLVLSAFKASDSPALPEQVAEVAAVLSGETVCSPDLYFMFGLGDIEKLGLKNVEPVLKLAHNGQEVWFYERWFRRR